MARSDIDWQQLRARLQGELITPSEPRLYNESRQVFNGRIQRYPAAVARCISDADVRDCVVFCAEHDIAISMRSGGHGASGFAVENDQLLIDLTGRQSVQINLPTQTVKVSGGALWGQVDLATSPRLLATPGGGCPTVGVGGLAQGGGIGPIARSCGLTIDNLVAAEVVLADGRKVTANERNYADLFWALRGGGGGNFGVVTSFTFRLHPIEGALAAGALLYDWKNAGAVLRVYRDWMQDATNDPRLTMMPICAFGPDGAPLIVLSCCFNGPWQAGMASITKAIISQLPEPLAPPDLGPITLPAFTGGETTTAFPGLGAYWRSGFLNNDFPDAAIDTMIRWFEQAPPTSALAQGAPVKNGRRGDLTFCFIESYGGVIAHRSPTATAFPHRNSLFSWTCVGVYPPSDPDLGERTRAWSAQFRDAMRPYLSGGVYVNYTQDDLPNWWDAYYGENFPRLQAIKQKYDPAHRFRFPQDLAQANP